MLDALRFAHERSIASGQTLYVFRRSTNGPVNIDATDRQARLFSTQYYAVSPDRTISYHRTAGDWTWSAASL